MKRTLLSAVLVAALITAAGAVHAAGFTYHGSLQDAGKPANGTYDIELTLYSAQTGGSVIAGPLTMYSVPVQGGNFSTEADFGPLAKALSQAYVGVKVRSAGKGDFATLDTRAAVTVDAATSCPGSWDLLGNAGNPAGSFLGTTDSQPLVLQTQGQRIVATDLIGGGTVPRWIGGGSLNSSSTGSPGGFIGGGGSSTSGTQRNQVGTFSVVGGGAQNSAGYTAATGYSAICGGNANTANVDYATIGGGSGNKITDNYATIGGGLGNTASGTYSAIGGGILNTASGTGAAVPGGTANLASGKYSFAVGDGAQAGDNSFVWSDGYGGTIFGSSAVNQFDIKASGGVGINGTPKNSDIELSIYPGASTVFNYSSVFMGDKGDIGGMLISVGDESSTTSNDAAFYIDQFDGTHQTRKLIVNTDGLSINGPNAVDTTGHPALSVLAVPSSSIFKDVLVDFIPEGNNGYTSIFSDAIPDTGTGAFVGMVFELAAKNNTLYAPLSLNVATIAGNTTVTADIVGNLDVTGVASKTGGGSWAVSSDRRIKQDVAPIHDALDTVMKLRPVNFRYTPEYRAMEGGLADRSYAGFIAQEYADVFPTDVVSTSKQVPGAAKNDPTILALDPNPALITTVAAVQELAVENSELHKQVDALEARLSKLEAGKGH